MKDKILGVFFVCCLVAVPATADQEVLDLLVAEVDNAVQAGDKATAQLMLEEITEIASMTPEWVDERFAAASFVEEEQLADFEMWSELNGEAEALMQAGELEAALEIAEGAFLLAQDVFGEAHWITIRSTRDVGYIARAMGDAETADAFYNEALAASIDQLGEGHPETQAIAALIAELYAAAGAVEEAMALREIISSSFEAELGSWHTLTLDSMIELVSLYEKAGDFVGAAELLRGVCGLYAASLSTYHPGTIDCESYLAQMLRDTGNLDEAQATLQTIIANIEASNDGINEVAIGSLMQLADIYQLRGEYQVAKELLSGLVPTAQQIGAVELSYTGKNYLGRILASEGKLAEAQTLMEDVVNYGAAAWGDRPLQYYNSILELGGIYQRQSRLNDAEAIFEDSMMALLEIVGEQHPSTLVAMNNLGNIYEQLGLYDDANLF